METERRDGWDADGDHCQAQSKLDRIRMGYDDYFASDDSRAAIATGGGGDSLDRDRPTDGPTAPTTDLLSSPCLGIGSADLGIDSLLRRTSLGGCLSVVSPFYFSSRGTLPSEWVALAGIRTFAMGVQWIAVVLVAINREPSPLCLTTPG